MSTRLTRSVVRQVSRPGNLVRRKEGRYRSTGKEQGVVSTREIWPTGSKNLYPKVKEGGRIYGIVLCKEGIENASP